MAPHATLETNGVNGINGVNGAHNLNGINGVNGAPNVNGINGDNHHAEGLDGHTDGESHFTIDYGNGTAPRHFEVSDDGNVSRQRELDPTTSSPSAGKPNILYIMADQMAAPILKMHDKDSPVKTPNIDALAKDGVVFDSAYCNGPLCAPSRFVMCTGQLPHKIGAYDNASTLASDIPTYAHYLRNEGYETILAGKMHFIGPDQLHGYERRLTTDIYPGDFGWSVNWDKPEERQEWYHNMSSVLQAGPCARSNQLDFDEEVIFKSTQYLYDYSRRDPNTRRPFSLTVAMTHPHDPYTITPEQWDRYEGVDIPLPKHQLSQEEQDPHATRILKSIEAWDKPMPPEAIKRARRAYFGACSYVDDNIGKLLLALRRCNLDENTVVVFSGDHGDMLGERSLWYKMNWYEMSARVPLLFHYPKMFQPGRVKESVSTMDLGPTFVDIVGGRMHPQLPMDGRSFYGALRGTQKAHDEVIGEYMGEGTISPVVMIRRGPWKFITSLVDPPQLFHLPSDPHELTNLATTAAIKAHPEHAKVFADFAAEAKKRWDLSAIHDDVLKCQRQRRLCWGALKKGYFTPWDYEPADHDPAREKYIRSTIPLDDLERRARYPPVDAMGQTSWLASSHGLAGAKGQ
ncbi:MAG: hypothetical protein Q9162_007594 [Coniocarpon cinnabarinum]